MNNYEVRVAISSPIILEGNRLRLDKVLQSYDQNPPITLTNGLYHASQSIIGHVSDAGTIIISDNINPHQLPRPEGLSLNIDPNSGVWQSYKRKVGYLLVDELVFYCQGNKDFIKEAILSTGFLGGYTSLGFGEVSDVQTIEMDADYSFVKERRIMRSIPVGTSLDINLGSEPLIKESYFEGLDDCYCTENLIPCYTPTQI